MEKKLAGFIIIALILAGIFISPDISFGQEAEKRVFGKIIEIAYNEQIIQVGNKNFIVTHVYVEDGTTEEPVPGFFRNLEIGSPVMITCGDKHEGFWKTKNVVVFTGKRKEEILKKLEEDGIKE